MIEINELRLNNWISFKGLWNGKVGRISEAVILIKGNGGVFDPESFDGVKLNIQLLQQIGFKEGKRVTKPGYELDMPNWCTIRLTPIESDKGLFACNLWGHGRISTPSIRYLHQLQNLYFSLTGTELQITL